MKKALYIGSFDMFTNGHMDVIDQTIDLFDEIIICIANNPLKKRHYTIESSVEFINTALKIKGYDSKVKCCYSSDITTDIMKNNDCEYLIRGIRNSTNYSYEENLAKFYREMMQDVVILYVYARFSFISSTAIRELLSHNKKVDKYIPADLSILRKES